MMRRTVYEAPITERFQVELEGGLMAASIMEDAPQNANGVSSSSQEYESFDGAAGFETGADGSIKWE